MKNRKRFAGFTLIEMLVTIGIIAIMFAILLPSVVRARRQALTLQCMNNLSQIYKACRAFQQDPKHQMSIDDVQTSSWVGPIFPYLEDGRCLVCTDDVFGPLPQAPQSSDFGSTGSAGSSAPGSGGSASTGGNGTNVGAASNQTKQTAAYFTGGFQQWTIHNYWGDYFMPLIAGPPRYPSVIAFPMDPDPTNIGGGVGNTNTFPVRKIVLPFMGGPITKIRTDPNDPSGNSPNAYSYQILGINDEIWGGGLWDSYDLQFELRQYNDGSQYMKLLFWGGEPDYLDIRDSANKVVGYDAGRDEALVRIPYPAYMMDPKGNTIYNKGVPKATQLSAAECQPLAPQGCIWFTSSQTATSSGNSSSSSSGSSSSGSSSPSLAQQAYNQEPVAPPNAGQIGTYSASPPIPASYGMNGYYQSAATMMGLSGKVFVMDYYVQQAKPASDTWVPNPTFARHLGKANVLWGDGSVSQVWPSTIDPQGGGVNNDTGHYMNFDAYWDKNH